MKKLSKAEMVDKYIQTLGKVLYLNSIGVKLDISWEYYSILVMTGRQEELLQMFSKIDEVFNQHVEKEPS